MLQNMYYTVCIRQEQGIHSKSYVIDRQGVSEKLVKLDSNKINFSHSEQQFKS